MLAGVGGEGIEHYWRHVQRHNQSVEILKRRFEKLGIDYTRGFMVACYNKRCGRPRWWIMIKEFFWTREDIAAAKAVLEDAGIDPWSCGDDLFKLGIGIEQE